MGPEVLVLARVYTGITQTAFLSRRTAEGLTAGKRAMEIAERFHDDARWAGTAIQYAVHLIASGRLAESRTVQERAWQIVDRLNIGHLAFISTWSGGGCRAFFLDIPEAQHSYQRELSKPRVAQYRPMLQALFGDTLARAGDLAGARRLSETAAAEIRADVLFYEGKWDESETLIRQKLPQSRHRGDLASLTTCLITLANI